MTNNFFSDEMDKQLTQAQEERRPLRYILTLWRHNSIAKMFQKARLQETKIAAE
jgi:hypothetical protein